LLVGEDIPACHVLGVRGAVIGDDEAAGVSRVGDSRENLHRHGRHRRDTRKLAQLPGHYLG
jgi:hypothetical protein